MDKIDLSFVYDIAHELKGPVITIEGFLNALIEDFGLQLPKDAIIYLDYIEDAVKRLKSTINDLLNLSIWSQKSYKIEKFFLKEIINSVLLRMKPIIIKKNITIILKDSLPVIYGRKKQMELAWENLISNAIKYIGKNNPNPIVEIGITNIKNKQVIFIKDNGIGIEKRYINKIFDMFQRTPSAKKESEGTGIGLFIVKNIIESHNGEIWVKSELGKGSIFYIYLPERQENGSFKDNHIR